MNKVQILRDVVYKEHCLLHGSASKVEELRPHYTDGEMALCATPYPEIAVFLALVRACQRQMHGWCEYNVSINNKRSWINFTISPNILKQLIDNDIHGYVYVLDSEGFKKIDPIEYRSFESRYCVRTLTITKEHLPFMLLDGVHDYRVSLNPLLAKVFN